MNAKTFKPAELGFLKVIQTDQGDGKDDILYRSGVQLLDFKMGSDLF